MGWIQEALQELPLSAVLKERVALIQDKYDLAIKENEVLKQQNEFLKEQVAALNGENEELRSQIPSEEEITLGEDTERVVLALFKNHEMEDRRLKFLATNLKMEPNILQYHLDKLKRVKLAKFSAFVSEDAVWTLTARGRAYVVERKLWQ